MSRKTRYVPLEARISNVVDILEAYGKEPGMKDNPYVVGLYNGLEIALSELEQRPAMLKELKRKNWISKLFKATK